jgi:hypothetical protein
VSAAGNTCRPTSPRNGSSRAPCNARPATRIVLQIFSAARKPITYLIDPTPNAHALWVETHPLPTAPDNMGGESATSLAGTDQRNAKCDPPVSKRPNDKTWR